MKLDVVFNEQDNSFGISFNEQDNSFGIFFGEVSEISDGGYERGYAEGYAVGETNGYMNGHDDGVEEGYADGYADGSQVASEVVTSIIEGTTDELVDYNATKMRNYAFYNAINIKSVYLPNLVNMGQNTFTGCSGLTDVYLPKMVTAKKHVFRNCTKLERLELPALKVIQGSLCTGATSLAYVDTLSVTEIESTSFEDCAALVTFILRNNEVATLDSTTAFDGTPIASGTGYIYVPDDLVEQYKVATNWLTYADQIKPLRELPADV